MLHQGNVVATLEFARRYGDQGIIFISCNPGNLKTELQRHTSKIVHKLIVRSIMHISSAAEF